MSLAPQDIIAPQHTAPQYIAPQGQGLSDLSNELIQHVVSYLDPDARFHFSLVNKRFNAAANRVTYHTLHLFPSRNTNHATELLRTISQSSDSRGLASYVRAIVVYGTYERPDVDQLVIATIQKTSDLRSFHGKCTPGILAALCTHARNSLTDLSIWYHELCDLSPPEGLAQPHLSHLTELSYHESEPFPAPYIDIIAQSIAHSAPRLRVLQLAYCKELSTLRTAMPPISGFPMLEYIAIDDELLDLPGFSDTPQVVKLYCNGTCRASPTPSPVAPPKNAFPALRNLSCAFNIATLICAEPKPLTTIRLAPGIWPDWKDEWYAIIRSCSESIQDISLSVDEVRFPEALGDIWKYMQHVTRLEIRPSGEKQFDENVRQPHRFGYRGIDFMLLRKKRCLL